jgi:hypothetical protein
MAQDAPLFLCKKYWRFSSFGVIELGRATGVFVRIEFDSEVVAARVIGWILDQGHDGRYGWMCNQLPIRDPRAFLVLRDIDFVCGRLLRPEFVECIGKMIGIASEQKRPLHIVV